MEFTGEYYSFYTDKKIEAILALFSPVDFQIEETAFAENISYFYYKNKEMYERHLDKGYNLNSQDEGCFCLETQKTAMKGAMYWNGYEEIPVQVNIQEVTYIFLVLPEKIEHSAFSRKIYDQLLKAIERAER